MAIRQLTEKALLEYLNEVDYFKASIDGWLVKEFIYTLKLIRQAKAQIKTEGNTIIHNVSKTEGREVYQPTAAFASYKALIKQALDISKQLPVTPKARKELETELASGPTPEDKKDNDRFEQNK